MRDILNLWRAKLAALPRKCDRVFRFGRWVNGDDGSAIVEMAVMLPVTLVVLTSLLSFGVYINNSLEMTNATSLAGQYLASGRSTTLANDPCQTISNAFGQVSPALVQSKLTFSLSIGGTSYPGTTCAGAAASMLQGASAQITVTYPCGPTYVNFIPGCPITSQVTEIIQ